MKKSVTVSTLTLHLCPDASEWDPYSPEFADQEDSFVDFRGDLNAQIPKTRKFLDDRDICDIRVSEEQYEHMVSSIVAKNYEAESHTKVENSSHSGFMNPMCDNVYIQAAIADLTAYVDEELLCTAVNERTMKSKIAMESGSIDINTDTEDVNIFESSAAHADTPKGITAEKLSKVWQISHEEARRMLDVTMQLNKQDANAMLSRRFGTNDRMLR